MRAHFGFRALTCGLAGVMSAPAWAGGGPSFTEVAQSAGVVATHTPAPGFFVSQVNVAPMTGGGTVGDFNNDGFQDIYVITSGNGPDKLFINNGNGTFTDQAAAWGLGEPHMGLACCVGDYNRDGWLDLYVTSFGPNTGLPSVGQHRLWRNNGDGTFSNVAVQAGVNMSSTAIPDGFGPAFGDYDLDGDLDLFVTGWVENNAGNRLFRNNGDGTFTDVTVAAGVFDLRLRGFAPRFVDLNGDRFPELAIAADFGTSRLFRNLGNGTFVNVTQPAGVGLDGNGMGSAIGDVNNDGRLDWYVTSIYTPSSGLPGVPGTGNMLYVNQGALTFQEMSVACGVNDGGWGWGTTAIDVDHDGWQDLVETNGWFQQNNGQFEWADEQSYLWRNNGNLTFTEIALGCGFVHTQQGRGLHNLDYDNDGDQDVVIFTYLGRPYLFRNDLQAAADTHWLRIVLDSRGVLNLAPNGFGARITVTAGGQQQVRYVDGGSNYLGCSELPAHFGLGAAASASQVHVLWPNGSTTILNDVAANQTLTIRARTDAGDVNCDGALNNFDIDAFVLLLTNPAAYAVAYPNCDTARGDTNGDGLVNNFDVDSFVNLLLYP